MTRSCLNLTVTLAHLQGVSSGPNLKKTRQMTVNLGKWDAIPYETQWMIQVSHSVRAVVIPAALFVVQLSSASGLTRLSPVGTVNLFNHVGTLALIKPHEACLV